MLVLLDSLQLAFGIALLVAGGESMVRGAAALAKQLGVPSLVVGLTVVAFGTSAPELAVNVTAALGGNGALAFGNIIGSNLANVGLVLAAGALLRPLRIQSIVITREAPMMLLGSAAALVMGSDALRGAADSQYDRAEGLLLLLLFGVFLYYTLVDTLRKRTADPFVQQAREQGIEAQLRSYATSTGLLAVGLLGLALGGRFTVNGAVGLAAALGVSKGLIGLTIIAIGTSLPELSTSIMAARRGETDLAVGNVIGSNIFNLLFVLGITASIHPVPVARGGHWDLGAMIVSAGLLLVFSLREREIDRLEAALLVTAYLGYLAWRTL